MGSLFGKPKRNDSGRSNSSPPLKKPAATVTEKDKAILDLKNARDRLRKFKKKLETESEKLQSQAKELVSKKQKNRALLLLKLRKYKEKEVDNVDAQLLTVFQMIEDIEWESANIEVMKALKSGTDALNKMHEEMSVEDVEALLEETNEAIEVENAINGLLAGQLSQLEDDELLAELDGIMNGMGIQFDEDQPTKQTPQLVVSNEERVENVSADQELDLELDLPEVPTSIPLPIAPSGPIEQVSAIPSERIALPS